MPDSTVLALSCQSECQVLQPARVHAHVWRRLIAMFQVAVVCFVNYTPCYIEKHYQLKPDHVDTGMDIGTVADVGCGDASTH